MQRTKTKSEQKKVIEPNPSTIGNYFMGIDPGLQGAITIIDEKLRICEVLEMKTEFINLFERLKTLKQKYNNLVCAVEHLHAFPKQAGKSLFTYASNYGRLKAYLEIAGIPYVEVANSSWRKSVGIRKTDGVDSKEASIKAFQKIFPEYMPLLNNPQSKKTKKLNHDKAESSLIAYFALRYHFQGL